MDIDGHNGNGQHSHPVERVVVEFDPNTGQLHYRFENSDHHRAIGHLEMAQMFMFRDLQAALEAKAHAD